MMRPKKAAIASAAIAGLLMGSSTGLQASALLLGLRASVSGQDEPKDNKPRNDSRTKNADDDDKKADKKVKEKHACKGQNSCKGKGGCKSSDNGCKAKNSCKGKGGCATDGAKMPS
jgi:hypothetical protein